MAVGGSTLFSTKLNTASQAFLPPPEKGGTYASASAQYIRKDRRGLNIEVVTRAKQGLYNGFQRYRPVLYDVNGVFAPRLRPGLRANFLAGFGGQSLIFYNQTAPCHNGTGICPFSVSSTHLLVHAGAGLRYTFWGNFFVRPEVHYYHVFNNTEFHSDNVFRMGASVGYTFGP